MRLKTNKKLINYPSKFKFPSKLKIYQSVVFIMICILMLGVIEKSELPADLMNKLSNSEIIPSNYKKLEIFSNDVKKAIDNHNIISFDIFDTLLIRPYVKPTDLFAHLELLNNASGFSKARIKAEFEARKKASPKKEDISIDEIYQQIDSKYKWLKEKEMSLEYSVLSPRPEVEKIYKYARKQNKKIIIVSDMYLPQKFLTDVLKKCGYTAFDEIFVSSEYGKTKASGSLYQQAMEKLGIPAKDVLHIGDNLESDIKRTRQLGIDSFFVPKAQDCLLETDPRIRKFYKDHKDDLGASIMLGLLAAHSERPYKDYWFDFGYKYAGPVIFGYMQWLDAQLKKDDIHRALFMARDGYTLEKVFNLIKTSDIKTHYIYLPRKIALKFFDKDYKVAKNAKEEYALYLKQFDLQDQKLALIDSVTLYLSAQKTLVRSFPEKLVKGYYWFIRPNSELSNMVFSFYQKDHIVRIGDIIELFMTAPTPPIDDIQNSQPVFKESNIHELERIKIYSYISHGAVSFAKDYVRCFNKLSAFFSCDMLIDWVDTFCFMPTEMDKSMFYKIKHASDMDHKKYLLLFPNWYR